MQENFAAGICAAFLLRSYPESGDNPPSAGEAEKPAAAACTAGPAGRYPRWDE